MDAPQIPPPREVSGSVGLERPHVAPFKSARIEDDELVVEFLGGIAPCNQLDHVEVRNGDDAIYIAVVLGNERGSAKQCEEQFAVGIPYITRVALPRDVPRNAEVRDDFMHR